MIKQREHWIDIARGIAILLVCAGHAIGTVDNISNKFILSFHMPLFFILSGILFNPNKNISFKTFLSTKAKRLLIPQIILGGVLILWDLAMSLLNGDKIVLMDLFDNFSTWFLLVLFIVELVIFALNKIKCFDHLWSKILLASITLTIVGLIQIFVKTENCWLLILVIVPMALLFYLVGLYFKKVWILKFGNRGINLIAGIVLLAFTLLVSYFNSPVLMFKNNYGNIALFAISSLFGTLGVFFVSKSFVFKPLEWCGMHSIIIYIVQFKASEIGRWISNKSLSLMNISSNILLWIIAIVVTLVLSVFVSYLLFKLYLFLCPNKKNTQSSKPSI